VKPQKKSPLAAEIVADNSSEDLGEMDDEFGSDEGLHESVDVDGAGSEEDGSDDDDDEEVCHACTCHVAFCDVQLCLQRTNLPPSSKNLVRAHVAAVMGRRCWR
jgi:hypothetical protein